MAKNKHQEAGEAPSEPQVEAEAPTVAVEQSEIMIQGFPFNYTPRYNAGHVLLEGEAHQLNGVLGENLRNNFAGQVKKVKEAAEKERGEGAELTSDELEALASEFAKYEAEYVFSGKRVSRGPADPVKAKARKMARETIEAALRSKGIKPADLAEGKMDDLIEQYLGAHPEVTDEAKRQVEQVKNAAASALGGVDLDSLKAPAAPAQV